MFDLTFLVYGGLYQITCLFLLRLLLVWFAVLLLSGYVSWSWGALVEVYVSCILKLLCLRAFSYSGAAKSNVSWSYDSLDILWLIKAGSCFRCNCRHKNECATLGNYLGKSVVCKAEVKTPHNESMKRYIGMTANDFKHRYRNHLKSFRNTQYANETELSKYIWRLKMENREYQIKWSIIKHASSYKYGSRRCNLCLEEKMLILKSNKKNLLNKTGPFLRNLPWGGIFQKGPSASLIDLSL